MSRDLRPPVDILTRLSPERLRALVVDPGFAAVVKSGAVRGVLEQVLRIGGEVTAAVAGSRLVGYVTVHPIEPVRWPRFRRASDRLNPTRVSM